MKTYVNVRAKHCTHPKQDHCDCDWCRYVRQRMRRVRKDEVGLALECGHLIVVHERSSTFDFPDERKWCAKCEEFKLLDSDLRELIKEANNA